MSRSLKMAIIVLALCPALQGCPDKDGEPAASAVEAPAPAPIDEAAIKAEAAEEAKSITTQNAEAEAARLEAELAADDE